MNFHELSHPALVSSIFCWSLECASLKIHRLSTLKLSFLLILLLFSWIWNLIFKPPFSEHPLSLWPAGCLMSWWPYFIPLCLTNYVQLPLSWSFCFLSLSSHPWLLHTLHLKYDLCDFFVRAFSVCESPHTYLPGHGPGLMPSTWSFISFLLWPLILSSPSLAVVHSFSCPR